MKPATTKATFDYDGLGVVLGVIAALATFAASWIYCMAEYGFLWGFGFGWVPSAMLAAIVGWVVRHLWWLAAIFLAIGIIRMFVG